MDPDPELSSSPAESPGARRRALLRQPGAIHFLHVGKAAGTQIKQLVTRINATGACAPIVVHPHVVRLAILPDDARYFFSTRDPITRFRSGFYSRRRRGRPMIDRDWTAHEALAFDRFEHANDLAEALFEEGATGRAATAAIRSITHNYRNIVDWFAGQGHLFEVSPPIWIIRQERFAEDFAVFVRRIGLRGAFDLGDGKPVHANDYTGAPPLSEKARRNLRAWYAQDYAFLDLCEAWMRAETAGRAGRAETQARDLIEASK